MLLARSSVGGRQATGRRARRTVATTRNSVRRDFSSYRSNGIDDEDDDLDDLLNPALQDDSWDKALANQQKGYDNHGNEKKAKK